MGHSQLLMIVIIKSESETKNVCQGLRVCFIDESDNFNSDWGHFYMLP